MNKNKKYNIIYSIIIGASVLILPFLILNSLYALNTDKDDPFLSIASNDSKIAQMNQLKIGDEAPTEDSILPEASDYDNSYNKDIDHKEIYDHLPDKEEILIKESPETTVFGKENLILNKNMLVGKRDSIQVDAVSIETDEKSNHKGNYLVLTTSHYGNFSNTKYLKKELKDIGFKVEFNGKELKQNDKELLDDGGVGNKVNIYFDPNRAFRMYYKIPEKYFNLDNMDNEQTINIKDGLGTNMQLTISEDDTPEEFLKN